CRALTARGYPNIAPLLGEMVRVGADGTPRLLALMQGYVHTQGDAWERTQNLLERALQALAIGEDENALLDREMMLREFSDFSAAIGKRLGEMHVVLAAPSDDAAFAPEIAGDDHCARWAETVQARLDEALAILAQSPLPADAPE